MTDRLPDAVILDKLAARLAAASQREWYVDGDVARGPGTVGVTLGEDHTGEQAREDLATFLAGLDEQATKFVDRRAEQRARHAAKNDGVEDPDIAS